MKTILLSASLFAIGLVLFSCSQSEPTSPPAAEAASQKPTPEELTKRGEYLVGIMGCDDCHSPKIMTDQGPAPDPERRLSGHPANEPLPAITDKRMIGPGQWALFNMGLTGAVGPWGTSFAANLTPHETGIGTWTLEQFTKALREGKLKGLDNGRMLLPPMPWVNYRHLTDDDLAAVFAFLKSLKPVDNVPPAPVPPVAEK